MERMASRNEKMTETAQVPQDMPTSPWTETFQNAATFASQAASPANRQSQRSQQIQPAQRQAATSRPAASRTDSDAARPTQDALSEIFNGV